MIRSKRNFLAALFGTAALAPVFEFPSPANAYDRLKCCWSWYESKEILNARPLRRDGIAARRESSSTILSDTSGRDILRLNPTAGRVWDLCDGVNAVDDMVAAIVDRYDVTPGVCAADVVVALAAFKRNDLIVC